MCEGCCYEIPYFTSERPPCTCKRTWKDNVFVFVCLLIMFMPFIICGWLSGWK